MNDNDDLTRPSTLLAAVGLGLVVGGALLLADLTRGQLRDMAIYPVAAVVAVGFVLGAWHGGLGLLGFVLLVWDAYTARKPEQAVAGGAEVAEPERTPSPLVGGYLLNEWEQYHRDGLRLSLTTSPLLLAVMLPLALGSGPGAEERRAVAVVVIGGQSLCLLVTLLVPPVAYSLFDDLGALRRGRLAA